MSKVKIQGNASGTGVLTVTAPNTSTDRVITLPDSTGTLATTADTFNPDAAVTINESGADVDFRVESDGLTHALFVEGGNGRVGVNTNSPDYSLHMVGDRLMTENLSNGNTGIFMRVKNGGSQVGNATIRTDNNGDITIYQGTTSEAVRLKFLAGGGICFNGDTAAANALDDYEEGTWTPSFSGNIAFSTKLHFTYTKIGSIVHVTGYCNNASGTFGTSWSVSGLPYTSSGSYNTAALWSHGQDLMYMMYMPHNSSSFNIRDRDGANMDSMSEISFDCTYLTNQ